MQTASVAILGVGNNVHHSFVTVHVSLLVKIWALDVWGELVSSKIFNPPFPVLKAGHSVSYSYNIYDVCLEWVNGVGFFLKIPVWLSMHMVFMYNAVFSKYDSV